jgi:hypothetical protein
MKKIVLASATLVLAMAAGSVSAANSLNSGTFGITVDTTDNFMINGKYFVAKDMAVLGGLGIRIAGGDAKGTDIGLMAGVRKYMKNEDLAPFVGGRFEYISTNDSNTKNLNLIAEAGAEYFVGKQFSLEGRVGFGYTSQDDKNPISGVTTKATYIGTGRVGISANFYF